jgi:hypothetical protein
MTLSMKNKSKLSPRQRLIDPSLAQSQKNKKNQQAMSKGTQQGLG